MNGVSSSLGEQRGGGEGTALRTSAAGAGGNPLATDLAKLSLWLATLARDHEFTFLDHALKSGDSLVGLTQAQIARRIGTRRSPAYRCFDSWCSNVLPRR